jgi:soluble P-type ATPase
MNVLLIHRDREFRLARPPAHAPALGQDLALSRVLGAMAAGDQFLLDVAENALLVGLTEPGEIEYRQRVLADCLKRSDVVRKIYRLALAAIQAERGLYFPRYSVTPGRILSRSVEVLELLVASLRQLRGLADRQITRPTVLGKRGYCVWRATRLDSVAALALRAFISVTVTIEIPGRPALELEHLLLDLNGTLTNRGRLIDGVGDRLSQLGRDLELHALSADTFGTLDELADQLRLTAHRISSGADKLEFLDALGAQRCAALGNGANDVAMLSGAALGIAVIGPEGASTTALRAADVVCRSILDALDLLLDPRAIVATLRA